MDLKLKISRWKHCFYLFLQSFLRWTGFVKQRARVRGVRQALKVPTINKRLRSHRITTCIQPRQYTTAGSMQQIRGITGWIKKESKVRPLLPLIGQHRLQKQSKATHPGTEPMCIEETEARMRQIRPEGKFLGGCGLCQKGCENQPFSI